LAMLACEMAMLSPSQTGVFLWVPQFLPSQRPHDSRVKQEWNF